MDKLAPATSTPSGSPLTVSLRSPFAIVQQGVHHALQGLGLPVGQEASLQLPSTSPVAGVLNVHGKLQGSWERPEGTVRGLARFLGGGDGF